VVTNESSQDFHNCPVIVRTFFRKPLQSKDGPYANLKFIATELLNSFGEAFNNSSLPIGFCLRKMSPARRCGLLQGGIGQNSRPDERCDGSDIFSVGAVPLPD